MFLGWSLGTSVVMSLTGVAFISITYLASRRDCPVEFAIIIPDLVAIAMRGPNWISVNREIGNTTHQIYGYFEFRNQGHHHQLT